MWVERKMDRDGHKSVPPTFIAEDDQGAGRNKQQATSVNSGMKSRP